MERPAQGLNGAPPWGEWDGLYEDRDGYLWAGSTAGVFRFKDGQYTHFTKKDGLEAGGDSFLLTHSGAFWVSNGSGLYRFRDGKFTRFIVNGTSFHTTSLHEDADGVIWFGTPIGLAIHKVPSPTPEDPDDWDIRIEMPNAELVNFGLGSHDAFSFPFATWYGEFVLSGKLDAALACERGDPPGSLSIAYGNWAAVVKKPMPNSILSSDSGTFTAKLISSNTDQLTR